MSQINAISLHRVSTNFIWSSFDMILIKKGSVCSRILEFFKCSKMLDTLNQTEEIGLKSLKTILKSCF